MNFRARAVIVLLLVALGYLAVINHTQAKVIDMQQQVIRDLFIASGGKIT